ncbi:MAG: lysostaphin resistance A-like protein [Chitinophagales bacterium]
MMGKTLKITTITIFFFFIYYILQQLYFVDIRQYLTQFIHNIGIAHFITYVIIGIPLFVGVGLIHDLKNFPEALGLNKPFLKALLFALICTLPMLIGYASFFDFNTEITLTKIFAGAIVAAFVEELFFRGILFGQIYRFTNIGFILSIVFGALIFALGHLYQSQDIATLIGIFMTTFLGAVLFAWVYVEWNNNLWIPIFLHLFMNLFWMLFAVSNNAFGGTYANICRTITITLIISLTIAYKVKKGIKFEVNRDTLFMKSL